MKLKVLSGLLVWSGMAALIPVWCCAQQSSSLEVTADVDCNWSLDGQPHGSLGAGIARTVPVAAGHHTLYAKTADGYGYVGITVLVADGEQKQVKLPLKNWHDKNRDQALGKIARDKAIAELAQLPTWTDPATGLMWTRASNADKIDWPQAVAYCHGMRLGGYSDWRLLEIDELAALYDPSQPVLSYKEQTVWTNSVRGSLLLGEWVWSKTPATDPREAQYFVFNEGLRYSVRTDHVGLHAICVRAPSGGTSTD